MQKKLFERLVLSMRQMDEVAAGRRKPSRPTIRCWRSSRARRIGWTCTRNRGYGTTFARRAAVRAPSERPGRAHASGTRRKSRKASNNHDRMPISSVYGRF
mgnify:CR=1 FL=1